MATYVGDLIDEVRRDTDNVETTTNSSGSLTEGISSEDFLRYMNFAQIRIQALLLQQNSTVFQRQHDFSVTANTAQYTIPDNVYLKESVVDVQYSSTGNEADFVELREIAESHRVYDTSATVRAYSRRAGSLFLSPVPNTSQGTLRVKYNRALDKLDLRRGQIDAVTESGGVITANTISISTGSDDDTRISGVTDQYISVVDKDGLSQAYNIPYTAYDSLNGNFTHVAHTLGTGESIAVDDYITVGKYTVTHLTEIDSVDLERYLQLYCALKIMRRDSSSDAIELRNELSAVEREIVETFQSIQKDEGEIQIDDPSLLFNDVWPFW